MNIKRIGIISSVEELLNGGFDTIRNMDLNAVQVKCWDDVWYTRENAEKLKELCGNVEMTSLWAGWPGPKAWNFTEGPQTLGYVPEAYREERFESLKKAVAFAHDLGIRDVVTHVGFIPENPGMPEYRSFLDFMKKVVAFCRSEHICFGFETGQETPITLLRTIQDLGCEDLWINLDPANLLMYGKANPVDAVGVYGQYIRSIHVKDGCYPTNGSELGCETVVGEGMVHFDRLAAALDEAGFTGQYIIEREISGEEQIRGILHARDYLRSIESRQS